MFFFSWMKRGSWELGCPQAGRSHDFSYCRLYSYFPFGDYRALNVLKIVDFFTDVFCIVFVKYC